MTHNFDSKTLYNLVDIKHATNRAVLSEVSRSLREWAEQAVENCQPGKIPAAELDMVDVELLINAIGHSKGVEGVIEYAEHALLSAWQGLRGDHSREVPWTVVAYDTPFNREKKGIALKAKVLITPST